MKMKIIKIILPIILLLGQSALKIEAQDKVTDQANHVYELFVANQGDSIHALLNQELRAKLSPEVFKDMFKQTEMQFGKLQSAGEWKKNSAEGMLIHYRDLKFERYTLRFLLSFDADGGMNTIRLMPAPIPTPAKPMVYDKEKIEEREVTVGADGFRLPGTLTLPVGKAKSPLVILVHGSGPQDRDETNGPNKPFRDLAWRLAERGIASVRYDKRTKVYGTNFVPQGREADYDTESVDDAVAIAAWAKQLSEANADSIYIVGHSLGATLAPRIAEKAEGLAGIIMIAGLARPLEDAVVEQTAYIASLSGNTDATQKQLEEIKKQADNVKKIGTSAFDDEIPLLLNVPLSYWKFANAYQPVITVSQLSLPILILQGERDYQVTMLDFGLWRMGLLRNKNVFFKSYPKLNHLLQEGSGKSTPFEYNEASTVPSYVTDDIATFIHKGRL